MNNLELFKEQEAYTKYWRSRGLSEKRIEEGCKRIFELFHGVIQHGQNSHCSLTEKEKEEKRIPVP